MSEFHLAYIKYPFKITFGLMREFEKSTGQSFHVFYQTAYKAFLDNESGRVIDTMLAVADSVKFQHAVDFFYLLAKTENSAIDRDEIEDGVLRVSWFPSNDDELLSQPWTYVLASLVGDITSFYKELSVEKKPQASSEKPLAK